MGRVRVAVWAGTDAVWNLSVGAGSFVCVKFAYAVDLDRADHLGTVADVGSDRLHLHLCGSGSGARGGITFA